jgi:transcriptional regulator with XRE-family HTH domain
VRIRRGWRQSDVARRAGVSDATVSRIERGHVDSISLHAIRAVASVLEIRLELMPLWRGGDLERLVNARHATLAESVIRRLSQIGGWIVRPEVSFAIRGERGVIDLLAWHPATRTLLVIELKTALVDIGELLGTFDRKCRLALAVARDLGWDPIAVGACLVISDTPTNRRHAAGFARTLQAALPDDGPAVRRWLRAPDGPLRGVLFFSDRHGVPTGGGIASRRRVSVGRSVVNRAVPRSNGAGSARLGVPRRPEPVSSRHGVTK